MADGKGRPALAAARPSTPPGTLRYVDGPVVFSRSCRQPYGAAGHRSTPRKRPRHRRPTFNHVAIVMDGIVRRPPNVAGPHRVTRYEAVTLAVLSNL